MATTRPYDELTIPLECVLVAMLLHPAQLTDDEITKHAYGYARFRYRKLAIAVHRMHGAISSLFEGHLIREVAKNAQKALGDRWRTQATWVLTAEGFVEACAFYEEKEA